jgi:dTDP-4-amino-4,6-dideoxygalactose transaminase
MVDLKSQYDKIATIVNASIQEVLDTNTYINGPKVADFKKISKIFRCKTRNSLC